MNIKKIFTISLVLLPWTNIYGCGVPGVSIGKLIIGVIIVIGIILKKIPINPYIPKYWMPFIIWSLIVPLTYIFEPWFRISDVLYKELGAIGFWLTLGYYIRVADIDNIYNFYGKSAFVFSLLFLIQFCIYFITGHNLVLLIPGMPLADATSINDYLIWQSSWNRQCSVFLEPSHFALYVGIYFCLLINNSHGIFFNKWILFYLFVILLTRSGVGYICVLASILIYFIANYKIALQKGKNILLLIILIFMIPFFVKSDILSGTLSRVSELSNDSINTSGYQRVFRGFTLLKDLDARAIITGVGQGNILSYANAHSMSNFKQASDVDSALFYLNGLQQIIVYFGIIGLFLWLYSLFHYGKSLISRQLVIIFVLLSCISATYNTPNTLFIFIAVILYRYKNKI